MKSFLKPAVLGFLIVVFVFLIFVPKGQAEGGKDKYYPGYFRPLMGMNVCSCPESFFITCICHIYDPTGGGPVSPDPSPESN